MVIPKKKDFKVTTSEIREINKHATLCDPTGVVVAIGAIARRYGMTRLSAELGLTRPALYRALSASGNPRFSTIVQVCKTLGIQFKPHVL